MFMIYNVLPLRDTTEVYADCLTFSSPETFSLSVANPRWDGTMEYSQNGKSWNVWDGSTVLGRKIYIRGSGNTKVTGKDLSSYAWTLDGSNVSCSGNIETLIDHETVANGEHPSNTSISCYAHMFEGATALVSAPDLLASSIGMGYYKSMFAGCISLTAPPAISGTMSSQSYNCCAHMFDGCTALTKAPELPSTQLSMNCYDSMFKGCTSLTSIVRLPATLLMTGCYQEMFSGCSKLKVSFTATSDYTQPYMIPPTGNGVNYKDTERAISGGEASDGLTNMFISTGGTFTDTPNLNAIYYLHKDCQIIGGPCYYGTEWKINIDSCESCSGSKTFNTSFKSNNTTYSSFSIEYNRSRIELQGGWDISIKIKYKDTTVMTGSAQWINNGVWANDTVTWAGEAYKTIILLEEPSDEFITWLKTYATMI